MNKSENREKSMITDSVSRRPYGAMLSTIVDDSVRIMLDGEACLLTSTDYIVKMRPSGQVDKICGFRACDILVEGFATAGEAECAGLEITFGILWGAISYKYSVCLQYQTPLPCIVYDRTRRGSDVFFKEDVTCILGQTPTTVARAINDALLSQERGNKKLLLAMELFSSARQELTERSRFISLVSSMEPLADQQNYGSDVSDMIKQFKDQIKALNFRPQVEASMMGRIESLSRESVRSAMRRLVREALPDDSDALTVIENAYDLRSRILHDGTTDADLNQKSKELEAVIRKIIASKVGLTLLIQ